MLDEEVDFPREGPKDAETFKGTIKRDVFKKRRTHSEGRREDDSDALRGKKLGKKLRKNTKSQQKTKELVTAVHPTSLAYKNLRTGMLVMGTVERVTEMVATIALPDVLKGQLKLVELSDALTEKIKSDLVKMPSMGEDYDEMSEGEDEEEKYEAVADLRDYLKVGQFLPCYILNCSKNRLYDVQLSSRESLLNSHLKVDTLKSGMRLEGSIMSREDHGYTVSIGFGELKAFLPFDLIRGDGKEFDFAQKMSFRIESINQQLNSVTLKYDEMIDRNLSSGSSGASGLYLGKLLKSQIRTVLQNGMEMTVSKKSTGVLSLIHAAIQEGSYEHCLFSGNQGDDLEESIDGMNISLDEDDKEDNQPENDVRRNSESDEEDEYLPFTGREDVLNSRHLKKWFQAKQELLTRIIYIDYSTNTVGLSSLKHVLELEPAQFDSVKLGQVFENAVVARIMKNRGLILELKVSDEKLDPLFVFVGLKMVSEDEGVTIDSFQVNQSVKCRIIGFSHIDGLAVATMRSSEINERYFLYQDISVGEVLFAKVESILENGLIMRVSPHIQGFCSYIHAAEVVSDNWQKQFKVGKKLKVRVLAIFPEQSKLYLTNKRSLVMSDLELFSDINTLEEGMVGHGVILSVRNHGCLVGFFNYFKGFLPIRETAHSPDKGNLNDIYNVGDVIKCTILRLNAKTRSCILSLSPVLSQSPEEREAVKSFLSVTQERVISATVELQSQYCVLLRWTPSGEHKELQVSVYLPNSHLSDYRDLEYLSKENMKVGTKVNNLLILYKRSYGVVVTKKKTLFNTYIEDRLPCKIEKLAVDTVYSGYISKIGNHGLVVEFMDHLTGFVHKYQAASNHVNDIRKLFYEGQSVRALLTQLDLENRQCALSLKNQACFEGRCVWLDGYFRERRSLLKQLKKTKYKVGMAVQLRIMKQNDSGVFLRLDDSLMAFACFAQVDEDAEVRKGEMVTGVILDVDFANEVVDVSLRKGMISYFGSCLESSLLKSPVVGQHLELNIEQVKSNYVILSLPEDFVRRLVYMPTRGYNGSFGLAEFKPHQSVGVEVSKVSSKYILADSLAFVARSKHSRMQITITDPLDSLSPDITLEVGMSLTAQVTEVREFEMILSLYSGVFGRIGIEEIDDINLPAKKLSMTSAEETKKTLEMFRGFSLESVPLSSRFKVGQEVSCRIISLRSWKNLSRPEVVCELSMRPSVYQLSIDELKISACSRINYLSNESVLQHFEPGTILPVWIRRVTPHQITVVVAKSLKGFVYIGDVSDQIEVLRHPESVFKVGQCVLAVVIDCVTSSSNRKCLNLSFRALNSNAPSQSAFLPDQVVPGSLLWGRVITVRLNVCVIFQFFANIYGSASVTDLDDVYKDDLFSDWINREGDFVLCRVISFALKSRKYLYVSVRPSQVYPELEVGPDINRVINSMAELAVGMKVSGYVRKVSKRWLHISLSRDIVGTVAFSHLEGITERSQEAVKKQYPIGKLVRGIVMKADAEQGKVFISLRKKDVEKLTVEDIKPNTVMRGHVNKVMDFGIFVTIENSNVSGLCHITEVFDEEEKDASSRSGKDSDEALIQRVKSVFHEGDYVRVYVLRVNVAKRQASLSMRPSRFGGHEDSADDRELEEDNLGIEEEEIEPLPQVGESSYLAKLLQAQKKRYIDMDEACMTPGKKVKTEEKEVEERLPEGLCDEGGEAELPGLSTGFEWCDFDLGEVKPERSCVSDPDRQVESDAWSDIISGPAEVAPEAGNNSEIDVKDIQEAEWLKETDIALAEKRLLDANLVPESADDFERAILTEPNSSKVWIQYVAFHLFKKDVQSARDVIERAIKRIDPTNSEDRFNVWAAYLNLENQIGYADTFQLVLKRALKSNDPKKIYRAAIQSHLHMGKLKEAEMLYQTMLKKWKHCKSSWIDFATFKFKHQQGQGTRELLDRALKSLVSRKHIPVLTKFAQLEFKFGDSERGRTIFDNLVASYPKRMHLWNMFLEMELRTKDVSRIRNLFERIIALKYNAKKMKPFFKRYLMFESSYGTPARVEYVKQKALEFIEQRG
ncbi:uncharacterized protein LOC126318272 [Schistocerca gregaria]|uniref:uncharacterized protein LOC126318272 n=1 Tax=Schistocerca gregaria TaxID=7010 RepID=UPI00211F206B|nr:uncharacterized protein LOC126318272 [Schistocerca gregaria]XP_049849222.1 uncharacterized protein LOC126318272 [Schistocerca gregaria]